MPDILTTWKRRAAKRHSCDYCGEAIPKGEIYNRAKLASGGRIYEWISHERCAYIASELWDYIDPDDGMTASDFSEGCAAFSQVFACPDCPSFDREMGDCGAGKAYCTDKIYDLLQTHDFRRDPDVPHAWRCVPKATDEPETSE